MEDFLTPEERSRKYPFVTMNFVAYTDEDHTREQQEMEAWDAINILLSTMYQSDLNMGSRPTKLEWLTMAEIKERTGGELDLESDLYG